MYEHGYAGEVAACFRRGESCQFFIWTISLTAPFRSKLGDEDFAEMPSLSG